VQPQTPTQGRLADLFLRFEKPKAALRHYTAAIAIAESDGYKDQKWRRSTAVHYLRMGKLLRQKGQKSAATKAFSQCETLYEDFGSFQYNQYDLARCSALAGHKEKALKSLEYVADGNKTGPLSLKINPISHRYGTTIGDTGYWREWRKTASRD